MKVIEMYEADDGSVHRTEQAAKVREIENRIQDLLRDHSSYGEIKVDRIAEILMDGGTGKVIFQILKTIHES